MNIEQIYKSLHLYFVRGNGFDTHRIWETLYSGSIPIVKRHYAFEYLDNLPVLYIDNYKDLYGLDLEQFITELTIRNTITRSFFLIIGLNYLTVIMPILSETLKK